ncbi:phosphotransferase family protein [Streptomyces sp. CBMA123]|uniref:phosphotransferase family protein n=1 Tax=Streptomyces sp. CBMA123 TaxID=1896313 RepID=UPI001661D5E1|nr:aminoglycoside 3'-phosphotransferase/choline kinase family protein [Streptomyces sp. CBMA123]MBD0695724.1 phosphotransferase [Streptomyces sp. CBMA123]
MLPLVETDEQWDAVIPDESVMRPGAEALCARLGVGGQPLERFAEGSVPVYAVGGEHVLKLFPAASARDGLAEGRVLARLRGALPIPTPAVRAVGEYVNGWRYVLMSRLHGEGLAPAWPGIPRADRERIARDCGEALAALHALDAEPLADVLRPGDWPAFLDGQRAGAVARQRERGLPEAWWEQIPDFLAAAPLPRTPQRALLHTEFMREHLITDPAGGWRLTGLIDFEPAMIGDPAYDLVAVGLFTTRADPQLLGQLLTAYGRPFEPRLLMAYTLLHVYSDLPWYLRELKPSARTLDDLAEEWFGVG